MDKDLKNIMKKLGTVINESLQESEKIQKLLREVENKGYSLTLSLAIIVGLNHHGRIKTSPGDGNHEGDELDSRQTVFDRKFLKALRIKISSEEKS